MRTALLSSKAEFTIVACFFNIYKSEDICHNAVHTVTCIRLYSLHVYTLLYVEALYVDEYLTLWTVVLSIICPVNQHPGVTTPTISTSFPSVSLYANTAGRDVT